MLLDASKKNYVIPTEYTRKITIDGITEAYPVYKVRLDQLYYNDRNDRIATWINKYKEENNLASLNPADENYNDIIQDFINESNPQAIKKTKNNIQLVGQREAGVVLNDGRIIDGNRRFTCLRMLNKETSKFQHMEVVILDRNYEHNEKEIKLLELAIQHGEEEKIDYNPIDKLVGLYLDVVKNELITIEEYANTTAETVNNVKKKIELSKLMVEFLEFIDAPNKFYIARELELDGPLNEMPSLLRKAKNEEEAEDLKLVVFSQLLLKPHSNMTQYLRKLKNIIDSDYSEEFIDEQLGYVEKTAEIISETNDMSPNYINKAIRANDDLKDDLRASVEKFEIRTKQDIARTKPLHDLEKSLLHLENIIDGQKIVQLMKDTEKEEFSKLLNNCQELLDEIKDFTK